MNPAIPLDDVDFESTSRKTLERDGYQKDSELFPSGVNCEWTWLATLAVEPFAGPRGKKVQILVDETVEWGSSANASLKNDG